MKSFKAKCILLISLLFVSHATFSQAAILAMIFGDKVASEKFNLSLEFGGVWGDISNLPDADGGMNGINFGIGLNSKLSDNFFISGNAYFLARRGFTLNSFSLVSQDPFLDAQFQNVKTDVQLNYIEVPILFSYQTNNRKMRFSVGPQFEFLQKSNAKYYHEEGDFEKSFSRYTNNYDWGPVFNVTYLLNSAHKGKGIHIHARYYMGTRDIFNSNFGSGENKMNYFSLHVSFPFITDELAAKNLEQ